jgi:hypothetical protein
MIWHARNTNVFTPAFVPLVGAFSARRLQGSAGENARHHSWRLWLTLIPALLACVPISLQAQSETAKLTVTVTVVPSAHMIFLPDGSTRVIVANGHESGSATNPNSLPENAAGAPNAADRKSIPANAPADSQGAKRTRRRVKP